jgi:hypothetical protein
MFGEAGEELGVLEGPLVRMKTIAAWSVEQ